MKIIIGIVAYAFIGCVFAGFLEDDTAPNADTLAQIAFVQLLLGLQKVSRQ